MLDRTISKAFSEARGTVSLPMYELPEMREANIAFLAEVQLRLDAKGINAAGGSVNSAASGKTTPEILFTQVCGYPLLKYYGDQYRILVTPHYAMPGCVGPNHRAFFMVRAYDPAGSLEDLRGRVFGCNSMLSNSGMNLPRLSLARVAGGKPFFSSVVMTGAHVRSLEHLDKGSIDICSIDNVTWGFFKKFRPAAAERYRVLAETPPSPSLPFVTSTNTTDSVAVALVEALCEIMSDPRIGHRCAALQLTDLSAPDLAAYKRLAEYEREAAELGYPEIA